MVYTRLMSHGTSSGDNSVCTSSGENADMSQRQVFGKPQEDDSPCQTVPIPITSSSVHSPSIRQPSNLLKLPSEIVSKILSYVPYSTVSQLRVVCRTMDEICSDHLNHSFQQLQSYMLARFQSLKSQMPRRESARRSHPLACESEIVETLHMRLTLLQMTFGKHIERKHCCFFAGEILDEVYRIIYHIAKTPNLVRPYRVTDELFDLSTMAMEYFKDHIEPGLPEISCFNADFFDLANPFNSPSNGYPADDYPIPESYKLMHPPTPPRSTMVLRKRIRRIKQGMKKYNNQLSILRRDVRTCRGKTIEQQKLLLDITSRIDDHDKKNEETSRKFSTLLQELNKCKTELQYWRFKAPTAPVACGTCGRAPHIPNEDLGNQPLPWLELAEGVGGADVANFVPLAGTSNDDWNFEWDSAVNKMGINDGTSMKVESTSSLTPEMLEESSKAGEFKPSVSKEIKPDSPKEHKNIEGKVLTPLLKRKGKATSNENQDSKKRKRLLKLRKK